MPKNQTESLTLTQRGSSWEHDRFQTLSNLPDEGRAFNARGSLPRAAGREVMWAALLQSFGLPCEEVEDLNGLGRNQISQRPSASQATREAATPFLQGGRKHGFFLSFNIRARTSLQLRPAGL